MKQIRYDIIPLIFSLFCIFSIAEYVHSQQSTYVIADINPSGDTPIQAYAIQSNTLIFQAEYGVPNWGNGAVGLGIDPDAAFLFVTYEDSDIIQLLDATTMTDEGTTNAPGAYNLAGIVYDITNLHVYTVDRETSNLYSYNWDAGNKILTLDAQATLQNANAWGIFLDEQNGLLYVANESSITYYNTDNWSLAGTIDNLNNYGVINVEKDIVNNFLYYGGSFANNDYLTKYDLNTGVQTETFLGNSQGVMGMTINQQTGLIYITTGYSGDNIRVFDQNLTLLYETGSIGNPTDIATASVAYNPLNFMIERDVECIVPGENVEYSLCYENSYPNVATNVIIIADIPANTSYVTSSNGGSYNSNTEEVTWNIGNVPAETTQTCVTLELSVSPYFPAPSTLLLDAGLDADNIGSMEIGEIIVTDMAQTCDIPIALISSDTAICIGDTAKLSIYLQGIPPWEIIYSDDMGIDTISNIPSNTYLLSVNPDVNTTYTLISVLGGNGMTNTSNGIATVIVNSIPKVFIGEDTTLLDKGKTITLTPGSHYKEYEWQDGSTRNYINTSDTGMFWVEISDYNSCKNTDSTHVVYIDMYVANAFTPDNDGINDKVYIRGNFFRDVDLKIFNRLGEMVFHTSNQYIGWDGTHNGTEQDMGVYYFYFTGTLLNGTSVERNGNITLIR